MDGFDDRPPTGPAGPGWAGPRLRPILLPPAGPWPGSPLLQIPPPRRPRWGLALALFALTALFTTTLGPVMYLLSRSDVTTDLQNPLLSLRVIRAVWGDPDLLWKGLAFSVPALTILLAHEMGHYVACRRYGLPCTPPFFLPVPMNFGTLGAFIRIQAPIRSKRELFDVGVAGPIAGFAVLVPFLLYGVARSQPAVPPLPPAGMEYQMYDFGSCLAIELAVRLFHGPLEEGMVLDLHPTAMGAWLGLFATCLNLLPLGQLDGGHILYAATGRLQRRLALPLWIALGLLSFVWLGWLLWCLIVLFMGLPHPPVQDERTPLDPVRRGVALLALLLLVLCFMPAPLAILIISR